SVYPDHRTLRNELIHEPLSLGPTRQWKRESAKRFLRAHSSAERARSYRSSAAARSGTRPRLASPAAPKSVGIQRHHRIPRLLDAYAPTRGARPSNFRLHRTRRIVHRQKVLTASASVRMDTSPGNGGVSRKPGKPLTITSRSAASVSRNRLPRTPMRNPNRG